MTRVAEVGLPWYGSAGFPNVIRWLAVVAAPGGLIGYAETEDRWTGQFSELVVIGGQDQVPDGCRYIGSARSEQYGSIMTSHVFERVPVTVAVDEAATAADRA